MLLYGSWKCVAALCLLAVAGTAAAQDRHEMMSGITSGVVSQSMQGRRRRPVQAPVATSRVFMPDVLPFVETSRDNQNEIESRDNRRGMPDVLPFVETSRDNQNEIAPADNRRGYYAQPPNAREDIDPKIDPRNSIVESNDNKDVVLNMNELSMDTQLLMSEAKTVEEFARIMGFELPPTNVNVAASSSGIAARFGGSSDDGEQHG
ncbi:uncharacterized protein LOC108675601 [Hyalella azteca]|uniref:Uncharacterized protein LOC108675601 n=1 Tax=Hyalella azteca TaxID=294128 RepID=A0A8B7NZB4_HYAAZ|nr:uncharacterized protein LOC108675601 [Hyalella azteca]